MPSEQTLERDLRQRESELAAMMQRWSSLCKALDRAVAAGVITDTVYSEWEMITVMARAAAYKQRCERLEQMLRSVEFKAHNGVCHWCRKSRRSGHSPDCELVAALAAVESESNGKN